MSRYAVPLVPFQEAIDDLISRTPQLAKPDGTGRPLYLIVQDIYREHGFSAARASSQVVIDKVQETIRRSLETGQGDAETVAQVAGWARGYASTVYRTNVTTAYAAGRFRQSMDPELGVVALRFAATMDRDTRGNHRAAHGIIAAPDDPIWDDISPPLGYNCRCTLEMVDEFEAERIGLLDQTGKVRRGKIPPGAHRDPGFQGGRPDKDYGPPAPPTPPTPPAPILPVSVNDVAASVERFGLVPGILQDTIGSDSERRDQARAMRPIFEEAGKRLPGGKALAKRLRKVRDLEAKERGLMAEIQRLSREFDRLPAGSERRSLVDRVDKLSEKHRAAMSKKIKERSQVNDQARRLVGKMGLKHIPEKERKARRAAFIDALVGRAMVGVTQRGGGWRPAAKPGLKRAEVAKLRAWSGRFFDALGPLAEALVRDIPGKGRSYLQRFYWLRGRRRASASPFRGWAGSSDSESTFFHELGHMVEGYIAGGSESFGPGMQWKRFPGAGSFWRVAVDDRDPKIKRLRDVTGYNYRPDEKTREDEWANPYAGKVYGDGASEAVSMLLEVAAKDSSPSLSWGTQAAKDPAPLYQFLGWLDAAMRGEVTRREQEAKP